MHIFVAYLLKCNFCKHLIIAEFISIPKVPETFHTRFPVWSSPPTPGILVPLSSWEIFRGPSYAFLGVVTSSIKSEEISANGMPCPGGMSVGIRSSFCWLYWSSSQVRHAFVIMVVMSWYKPSHLRCWPLAWFSLFLLVACGGWPKYTSAASQEW